jgi:hypothetical protein
MNDSKTLRGATIASGKGGKRPGKPRAGFVDRNGQTFLPPKSGSFAIWHRKMQDRDYVFE